MGYTIYHKFRSEGKEELVNQFYRRILGCLYVEGKSLLNLFKLNKDGYLTEETNRYYHEYSRDEKADEIGIDTDPKRGFTKTARKKYDIAVVLTYLFDDLLSGGECHTSGDYENVSQSYVEAILEGMEEQDSEKIKMNIWRYIQTELKYGEPNEAYTTDEIDEIVNSIMIYCEENKLSDGDRDELYNKKNPEPDDTDLEHIGEQVKQGFTSGQWRNGMREITF